ncbi:hypothetical protein LXL04_032980, partial [Taraxacum kok-saghyz]
MKILYIEKRHSHLQILILCQLIFVFIKLKEYPSVINLPSAYQARTTHTGRLQQSTHKVNTVNHARIHNLCPMGLCSSNYQVSSEIEFQT